MVKLTTALVASTTANGTWTFLMVVARKPSATKMSTKVISIKARSLESVNKSTVLVTSMKANGFLERSMATVHSHMQPVRSTMASLRTNQGMARANTSILMKMDKVSIKEAGNASKDTVMAKKTSPMATFM